MSEYLELALWVVAFGAIGYNTYQGRLLRKDHEELKAASPSRRVKPKK